MCTAFYLARELDAVQPEAALLVCLLEVREEPFSFTHQVLHLTQIMHSMSMVRERKRERERARECDLPYMV